MRKQPLILLGAALGLFVQAQETTSLELLARRAADSTIAARADCDTIIEVNGYAVRVVKNDGRIRRIGLNLFSDDLKKQADKDLLGYIEEAMLARSMGIDDEPFDKTVITAGSIADFKKISPDTPCAVNSVNSRTMSASWNLGSKTVAVTIPVGYDTTSKGSRSDIENDFISRLRSFKGGRAPFGTVDEGSLEPYKEDKFVLPGAAYHSKQITRNVYFDADRKTPVWDSASPLESIANLFIYPSDRYGDTRINISILKHEYGEKEQVEVPLNRFLAMCEEAGCMPLWGVEKFENGVLEGAMFLYNKKKGYDHTLKIECRPEDVINGKGAIKARAGLFIPANNVRELFAPYVKKTEKEKIKYVK